MIQLRLVLLGLTLIGTIGYAVYSHYRNQEQPQQYGRRRRRSFDADDNSTFPSTSSDCSSANPRRGRIDCVKDSCSICLTLVEDKDFTYLNCGHIFHQRCIQMWFNSEKKTCPNCRMVVM